MPSQFEYYWRPLEAVFDEERRTLKKEQHRDAPHWQSSEAGLLQNLKTPQGVQLEARAVLYLVALARLRNLFRKQLQAFYAQLLRKPPLTASCFDLRMENMAHRTELRASVAAHCAKLQLSRLSMFQANLLVQGQGRTPDSSDTSDQIPAKPV